MQLFPRLPLYIANPGACDLHVLAMNGRRSMNLGLRSGLVLPPRGSVTRGRNAPAAGGAQNRAESPARGLSGAEGVGVGSSRPRLGRLSFTRQTSGPTASGDQPCSGDSEGGGGSFHLTGARGNSGDDDRTGSHARENASGSRQASVFGSIGGRRPDTETLSADFGTGARNGTDERASQDVVTGNGVSPSSHSAQNGNRARTHLASAANRPVSSNGGDARQVIGRNSASRRRNESSLPPEEESQRSHEVQASGSNVTDRLPSLSEADTICNLKRRIAELERDKKQLGRLAEVEKEKCAAVETRLVEARGTITGLEASLNTLIEKSSGQRASESESTRVQRLTKRAKRIGDEAENIAKLPVFQRELVNRLLQKLVEMCKAIVHQVDVRYLLQRGEARHAWLPEPIMLCESAPAQEDTAVQVLRGAPVLPCGRVTEPPQLCSHRKAMHGGLFGRRAPDVQGMLFDLLTVISWNWQRWEVVTGAGETKTFEDMTREDVDGEIRALFKSPVAGLLCSKVQNKISNQMSSLKSVVVLEYLQGMGYLSKAQRLDITSLGDDNCIFQLVGRSLEDIGRELRTDDTGIHEVIRPNHLRRWRTSSYLSLRAPGASSVGDLAFCIGGANRKDVLFRNGFARRCFVLWSGRQLGEDGHLEGETSILSLARLDAWITAYLIVTRRLAWEACVDSESQRDNSEVNGAREGSNTGTRPLRTAGTARNSFHNTLFERLLPIAIEGVLQEIRQVVFEEFPKELHMPFDFDAAQELGIEAEIDAHPASYTPCSGPEGHHGELHHQAWRHATSSHRSPFDGQDYVLATSEFIQEHVCWWVGSVMDAFVGVCKSHKNDYEPVSCGDSCPDAFVAPVGFEAMSE